MSNQAKQEAQPNCPECGGSRAVRLGSHTRPGPGVCGSIFHQENARHTPTPWSLRDDLELTPGGSWAIVRWNEGRQGVTLIAEVYQANDQFVGRATQEPTSCANARLIVHAVNSFEAARAALRAVKTWAETPGEHGGNPYCKDFVRQSIAALAQMEGE